MLKKSSTCQTLPFFILPIINAQQAVLLSRKVSAPVPLSLSSQGEAPRAHLPQPDPQAFLQNPQSPFIKSQKSINKSPRPAAGDLSDAKTLQTLFPKPSKADPLSQKSASKHFNPTRALYKPFHNARLKSSIGLNSTK